MKPSNKTLISQNKATNFYNSSKLNKLPMPDELKVETYDRRPYVTTFDRLDLVVFFLPGKDNQGAIVSHFLDAITNHDQIVSEIEVQYMKIDELNNLHKKICRLFHNLDAAWNVVLNNNGKFYEFIGLENDFISQFGDNFIELSKNNMPQSEMQVIGNQDEEENEKKSVLAAAITNYNDINDDKIQLTDVSQLNIDNTKNLATIKSSFLSSKKNLLKLEELIEMLEDIELKAKFQEMYSRFIELFNLCSKQKIVYDTFSKTRNKRDEILSLIKQNEKILFSLKEKEKVLSYLICEDHVIANHLKKNISEIFPNVHLGYIISAINDIDVENMPYTEVINKIKMAKSPHHVVFRRYDFRFNPYAGVWMTLEDLREKGVCIEDPLLITSRLIDLASKGDKINLYHFLLQGHDPNYEDMTGKTALFMAASNNYLDIVSLLLKAGCKINHRDRNHMTTLMYSVKKGLTDMVRLLIDSGADINVCDRFKRGLSYYAILSGNSSMIRVIIPKDLRDLSERIWGYTPLHIAANKGDFETIKFLIQYGCSIYRQDKKKRIPEDIAKDNGYYNIAHFLCDKRLNAAGQKVYTSFRSFSSIHTMNNDNHSVSSISKASSMYTIVDNTEKGINFELWIGNIDSMDPKFCSEVNFTHIIFLRTTQDFPSQTQWVKRDRDIQFISHYIPPPLCNWCSLNRPRTKGSNMYAGFKSDTRKSFSDNKRMNRNEFFEEERNEECECGIIEIDGEDNWDALEDLIGPTMVYIRNELNQFHDISLSREIHELERNSNQYYRNNNVNIKKNESIDELDDNDEENDDIVENESQDKNRVEKEEEENTGILDQNQQYVYEMTQQNLINRNTLRLLICCRTGENLSPALAAIIILLREGNGSTTSTSSSNGSEPSVKVSNAYSSAVLSPSKIEKINIHPSNPPKRAEDIENHLKALRPGVNMSERIKNGIFSVQHKLDTKRLKRAQARVRNSVVDSIGF